MFEEEADKLRAIFGQQMVSIFHIGSTSVPGLSAKNKAKTGYMEGGTSKKVEIIEHITSTFTKVAVPKLKDTLHFEII